MDGNRPDTFYSGVTSTSQEMDVKVMPTKKRKSSRLGSVFRKLLGRKNSSKVKSQISLPTTSASTVEAGPTDFITSPQDYKTQRTASLPIVSRGSALGSHKPFSHISEERSPSTFNDEFSLDQNPTLSWLPRRRRNSMPNTYSMTPDSLLAIPLSDEQPSECQAKETDIGYAVTSGNNPKRRSRSAADLRSITKEHQMSPIQWRHRNRSDEIRYWRESISPTTVTNLQQQRELNSSHEPPTALDHPKEGVIDEPEVCRTSEASEYKDARSEHETVNTTNTEDAHEDKSQSRNTFDFGILASNMQEQDPVPVEERVITVEVKLMDLEYAISKLQAKFQTTPPKPSAFTDPRVPPPVPHSTIAQGMSSTLTQQANPDRVPGQSASTHTIATVSTYSSVEPTLDHKSHNSTHSSRPHPPPTLADPFSPSERPASTATEVPILQSSNSFPDQSHLLRAAPAPPGPPMPSTPQRTSPPPSRASATPDRSSQDTLQAGPNRRSITHLSIDHYATLVTLLRREQAARIRLESQVADLQREVFLMKARAQVDDESIGTGQLVTSSTTTANIVPPASAPPVVRESDSTGSLGSGRYWEGAGLGSGYAPAPRKRSVSRKTSLGALGFGRDREKERDRERDREQERNGEKDRNGDATTKDTRTTSTSALSSWREMRRKNSAVDMSRSGSGGVEPPRKGGNDGPRKGSAAGMVRPMPSFDDDSSASAEFETPVEGRGWDWTWAGPGTRPQVVEGGVF